MKKFIFSVCATISFTAVSFAQSNNPNNKLGADIVAAANVISKDYKDGKLKDFNQATIDHYFKTLLPGTEIAKVEDVTKVLNAMKSATSQSAIEGSKFSEATKAFLRKSLTDYSTTALVDDVKKSNIPENEKNIVLTVLAVNYNLIKNTGTNKRAGSTGSKGPSATFDIDFDDYYLAQGQGTASIIWGALGAVVGSAFCPFCSIIGAVIGIIIGTIPGPTTVSGPGGTHTYSSGGSHSYSGGGPQP